MFDKYNLDLSFDENIEFRISVIQAVLGTEVDFPNTARVYFDGIRGALHRAQKGEPSTELDYAFFATHLDIIRVQLEESNPEDPAIPALRKILLVVHEGLCNHIFKG